jgi:hypothetical protein
MRYLLALLAVGSMFLALPSKRGEACEGCVGSGPDAAHISNWVCMTAPDGPGEICTAAANGSDCNPEGTCKGTIRVTGDGSIQPSDPLDQSTQFASARAAAGNKPLTRECDEAVLAHRIGAREGREMRRNAASLTI